MSAHVHECSTGYIDDCLARGYCVCECGATKPGVELGEWRAPTNTESRAVAPLEEAGEPARPLGSMEFGGFTHAHLWDAYVAGVRDGQKHTSADEALIQGSADAYVKSVAPETTEPDDEAKSLVDSLTNSVARLSRERDERGLLLQIVESARPIVDEKRAMNPATAHPLVLAFDALDVHRLAEKEKSRV